MTETGVWTPKPGDRVRLVGHRDGWEGEVVKPWNRRSGSMLVRVDDAFDHSGGRMLLAVPPEGMERA